MTISKKGLELYASTSKRTTYPVTTGIPKAASYKFDLRGHELVEAIRQFREIAGIEELTVRGHDTGIFELEGENDDATFTVELPTVKNAKGDHEPKHFTKLK